MSDNFIGEIQIFGFDFAPYQWAQCNGATLSIPQYTALFSLLGITYGGNGTSTFQLPNLVNYAACNQGTGPGLTSRQIGQPFGSPSVTLQSAQMPMHNHGFTLWNQPDATKRSNKPAQGSALIEPAVLEPFPGTGTSPNTTFSPNMSGPSGQGQPHENRQPALAINYCIALYGQFPQFS
jgi:microcystin-dependent protein